MDSTKYIYFDDESPSVVSSYVNALTSDNNTLNILHTSPRPWDQQIDFIKSQEFDGLILDLRLDQKIIWDVEGAENQTARYRAEELAQKLRVTATEGEIKDIPIVLWSTDQRIRESGFKRDSTPKDLFDLKIVKTNINKNAQLYKTQLISLSKGYRTILQIGLSNPIYNHLGFEEEPDFIDSRLFAYFGELERPPAHDIARFILKEVVRSPGTLINKEILAARLGIDIDKSDDFSKLLEILREFKYKGIFSDGWETWYSFLVEIWWDNTFQSEGNIRQLKGSTKVNLIKDYFELEKIKSITPSEYDKTEKFWTVCVATKKPITLDGGLLINQPHKLPWQNDRYISFEAIQRRLDKKDGFAISPLDKNRLEEFKSSES